MTKNGSECIRILLHYDDVNVDVKDRLQRTPIMYAVINGMDSQIIGESIGDEFYMFDFFCI